MRISTFISSISILSEKYGVSTEILFIEWNPTEGKKLLHEELSLPRGRTIIKFIQVPPEIHNKFYNPKGLPVLDYIGKNVGIRRSKGKFILICSPDLIFQDEFFIAMKSNFFTDKYLYRAARSDVHRDTVRTLDDIPKDWESYIELLKKCRNSIMKTHLNFPAELYYNTSGDRIITDAVFGNGCGDFLLMARENWFQIGGCPETGYSQQFLHLDSMTLFKALNCFEQWILSKQFGIFHQDHDRPHHGDDPSPSSSYENDKNWGLPETNLTEILI